MLITKVCPRLERQKMPRSPACGNTGWFGAKKLSGLNSLNSYRNFDFEFMLVSAKNYRF